SRFCGRSIRKSSADSFGLIGGPATGAMWVGIPGIGTSTSTRTMILGSVGTVMGTHFGSRGNVRCGRRSCRCGSGRRARPGSRRAPPGRHGPQLDTLGLLDETGRRGHVLPPEENTHAGEAGPFIRANA